MKFAEFQKKVTEMAFINGKLLAHWVDKNNLHHSSDSTTKTYSAGIMPGDLDIDGKFIALASGHCDTGDEAIWKLSEKLTAYYIKKICPECENEHTGSHCQCKEAEVV